MFTKEQRASVLDLARVQLQGSVRHSTHISVRSCPAETIKYAVIVSKKVAKHAVDRNLIQRRLREALKTITVHPGIYAVYAKKGIETLSLEELTKELHHILGE